LADSFEPMALELTMIVIEMKPAIKTYSIAVVAEVSFRQRIKKHRFIQNSPPAHPGAGALPFGFNCA
jgi:hypothetical protein